MNIADTITKALILLTQFATPFARGGGLAAVALGIWGFGKELIMELIVQMDTLAVTATGNADFTPLGFVNYIFPLDVLLGHVGVLCTLVLVTAIIRIIKSFIPTIAS